MKTAGPNHVLQTLNSEATYMWKRIRVESLKPLQGEAGYARLQALSGHPIEDKEGGSVKDSGIPHEKTRRLGDNTSLAN